MAREFFLFEDREVHTAIGAMLDKAGMGGEVVILAMLEDEDAIRGKDALVEDKVGDLRQLLESVGWIGKDEVKLLSARLDETEDIAADGSAHICAEFLQTLGYEGMVVAVGLNTHHTGTTSRHEFERYTACARKEVEGCNVVKVDIAIEHVKEILLGEICCRAGLKRAWDVEVATLVLSCNYSHSITYP